MGRIEWSLTPDTLSTHSWTSFPFSNLLVINELIQIWNQFHIDEPQF